MADNDIYAAPREVTALKDCHFYHTTDVPGYGEVRGEWDLRKGIGSYLGKTNLSGKRVLDVGAASGFLTFYMERQGAEIISYDLSPADPWDRVPFAGMDLARDEALVRDTIRRYNNSYWLCHKVYQSKARLVHGTVYNMPRAIGPVDTSVFGSILLHLRDPFLALQNALQLTRETVIVTDMLPRRYFWHRFLPRFGLPRMMFLPEAKHRKYQATWWYLTPPIVQQFLEVLGFEDTRVTYHRQLFCGRNRLLYTVQGRRTRAPAILHDGPVTAAVAA
ncbi:MAG TPA: hypothetical protein VG013_13935 [Gemmataceae bacterium]|jgi:SAM-dependent methyltransferase|nr:hypothetical protein [Gemmataceae bacterium]